MTDHTELQKAANGAKNWAGETGEAEWYKKTAFAPPYFSVPDAEFIALCDPGVILALIAENKSMAEFKAHMVQLRETHGFESWAAVLVENDSLRKDAERYRFLREWHVFGDLRVTVALVNLRTGMSTLVDGVLADVTIDGYMSEEASNG